MLAKSKIISIILTIIFCVSAITCGVVFGVLKSTPQTNAETAEYTAFYSDHWKLKITYDNAYGTISNVDCVDMGSGADNKNT